MLSVLPLSSHLHVYTQKEVSSMSGDTVAPQTDTNLVFKQLRAHRDNKVYAVVP